MESYDGHRPLKEEMLDRDAALKLLASENESQRDMALGWLERNMGAGTTFMAGHLLNEETAVKLLESKEEWKRDLARVWLEKNPHSAGEAIIHRLREEGRKRKKKQRRLYWAVGIYCAALVGLLLVWLVKGLSTGTWSEFPWQLFQAFTWVGVFGSAGLASQFQKNATQVIAKFNDKRYIPELIEALSYKDKEVTSVALGALCTLLPTLAASDAELLSTEHRKALHGFLTPSSKEPALTRSILKALEQVGDERDLPVVRKLAASAGTNSRENEAVQTAIECLPFVEQRAESNRAASTLLRASASTPNSELLRPASESAESKPHTLLRPADSADSVPILNSPIIEVPQTIQSRSDS